jgi:hypothetical protein
MMAGGGGFAPRGYAGGMTQGRPEAQVDGEPAVRVRPLPVPRWVALSFGVMSVLLAPWAALTVWSLPNREVADHWAVAWGGFDVGLAAGLAATAVLLLRRSPYAGIAAAVTATLLVCDAWFDVTTAHGTMTTATAVAEAALVELPLAAACLWVAANVERVLADPRPYLEQAGFGTVRRPSRGVRSQHGG